MSYNQGKNHPKFIDLSSKRFGSLLVIEYITHPKYKDKRWIWRCICDCGKECFVRTTKFTNEFPQLRCKSCSVKYTNILDDHKALRNKLYGRYKRIAERKGLQFTLTMEEFCNIITSNCYYCGEEPKMYRGERNFISNSIQEIFKRNGIDKVNSKIGYTSSNSVSCCPKCNRAKLDYTQEDFYRWIYKAYNFLKSKETFNDYPEME